MYFLQTLDSNLVDDMIGVMVIQKRLMKKIIDDNELIDDVMEFWMDWNYKSGDTWWGDFNADELDDDEYNPIYNPLYPEFVIENRYYE